MLKKLLPLALLATITSVHAADNQAHHAKAKVLLAGAEVALSGNLPSKGEAAPAFRVVDGNFTPIALSDFKGKTVLISAVPSLDTGVCALQTKRFNDEVAKFDSRKVVMLTISTDLPFAQKRFCKAEGVENILVLSDAVWREFAEQYGLLIEDRGLLARSIFIVDAEGVLQYSELVSDVSKHPDYELALKALTDISAAESVQVSSEHAQASSESTQAGSESTQVNSDNRQVNSESTENTENTENSTSSDKSGS